MEDFHLAESIRTDDSICFVLFVSICYFLNVHKLCINQPLKLNWGCSGLFVWFRHISLFWLLFKRIIQRVPYKKPSLSYHLSTTTTTTTIQNQLINIDGSGSFKFPVLRSSDDSIPTRVVNVRLSSMSSWTWYFELKCESKTLGCPKFTPLEYLARTNTLHNVLEVKYNEQRFISILELWCQRNISSVWSSTIFINYSHVCASKCTFWKKNLWVL